eukprot:s8_g26.t1
MLCIVSHLRQRPCPGLQWQAAEVDGRHPTAFRVNGAEVWIVAQVGISHDTKLPAEVAKKMDLYKICVKKNIFYNPPETLHQLIDGAKKLQIVGHLWRKMHRRPTQPKPAMTCPHCGKEAGADRSVICPMYLQCCSLCRFRRPRSRKRQRSDVPTTQSSDSGVAS